MEIKAELKYPYSKQDRFSFIVEQNHRNGYEIKFTDNTYGRGHEDLQALGLTEEEKAQQERQRLDNLTLTPSDVERALHRALGMDFEDLKQYLVEKVPSIDIKALAIEFRAKDFWRGATFGENNDRIFDLVGLLLGYTPEDMDYLFLNKELPQINKERIEGE